MGLSHIHESQHGSSRILIRDVPALNTTIMVLLLRCTFFRFFNRSRMVTWAIPGHCSGNHPCCLRHHRIDTGQATGVILGAPAYPWWKIKPAQFFVPEYRDQIWSVPVREGTAFLPCSHRELRIKTGICRVRNSRMYPEATRKEHGSFQEWFGSFFIRGVKLILPRILRCAKDHAGCLPGVYTVMLETRRILPEATRMIPD